MQTEQDLISNPPNFVNATDGKMGPFPVLFVLDEFPQMPKLKAVIDGPAVGRGQKVSYLLIGQDLGQISGKYGKDDLETVISTTACKVILSQNNEQTAERFSKMIGQKTIQTTSYSRQEGSLNKEFNPFAKNVSYQLTGVAAIKSNDLLSLPMLKQVVLMQGHIETPIMADAPRFYLDKKIKMYSGFYEDGVVDLQFISKEHEFFLTFYNTFVLIEIDEESIDKKIKLKYDEYKDLYELKGKIFSVLSDYL